MLVRVAAIFWQMMPDFPMPVRIARPRQVYTGAGERNYVPVGERGEERLARAVEHVANPVR